MTCPAGVQPGQQEQGQQVKRFMVFLRYINSCFSPIQKNSVRDFNHAVRDTWGFT